VKKFGTHNGVVVIKATTETGAIELQCNKDYPTCWEGDIEEREHVLGTGVQEETPNCG
jgi:hypothetical protein